MGHCAQMGQCGQGKERCVAVGGRSSCPLQGACKCPSAMVVGVVCASPTCQCPKLKPQWYKLQTQTEISEEKRKQKKNKEIQRKHKGKTKEQKHKTEHMKNCFWFLSRCWCFFLSRLSFLSRRPFVDFVSFVCFCCPVCVFLSRYQSPGVPKGPQRVGPL